MFLFDLIRPAAVAVASRAPVPTLEITRFAVRIPGLPAPLEGFTIAHVSDLHIGDGHWHPQHLDEAAAAIARENPDVVLNTGDFLEGTPQLDRVCALASRLTVPGKNRNFAVLGNHDYIAGDEVVRDLKMELSRTGIQVLENESTCLRRGDAGISLGGLSSEAPGWDVAVRQLEGSERPRVVLLHIPDCAERLPTGLADLVLSGHTHGGQIVVPGLASQIVKAFCGSRYVEGMYEVNGSPMYISRGLGCVGLPMRFRADPQVSFITLTR